MEERSGTNTNNWQWFPQLDASYGTKWRETGEGVASTEPRRCWKPARRSKSSPTFSMSITPFSLSAFEAKHDIRKVTLLFLVRRLATSANSVPSSCWRRPRVRYSWVCAQMHCDPPLTWQALYRSWCSNFLTPRICWNISYSWSLLRMSSEAALAVILCWSFLESSSSPR